MLQTVAKRSTLFAPRAVAAVTQRGLAIDGMKGEFWGGVCPVRAPVLWRWGPAPAMLAYDTRRPSTPAGYSDKERGEEVRVLVMCCMDVAFIARATGI